MKKMNGPERVAGRFVHAYYTLFVGRTLGGDPEKSIKLHRLYNEQAVFTVAQTSQSGQRKVKGAKVVQTVLLFTLPGHCVMHRRTEGETSVEPRCSTFNRLPRHGHHTPCFSCWRT